AMQIVQRIAQKLGQIGVASLKFVYVFGAIYTGQMEDEIGFLCVRTQDGCIIFACERQHLDLGVFCQGSDKVSPYKTIGSRHKYLHTYSSGEACSPRAMARIKSSFSSNRSMPA